MRKGSKFPSLSEFFTPPFGMSIANHITCCIHCLSFCGTNIASIGQGVQFCAPRAAVPAY